MALTYPNAIFRGDMLKDCPSTVNGVLSSAATPGYFVTLVDGAMALATTGAARVFLLKNREYYDQTSSDAYASGDTGEAYRLKPETEFRAIAAAATYTQGAALTVNASGQLAAATTGDVVVAYADESKTLAAVGYLDVVIANSYVAA